MYLQPLFQQQIYIVLKITFLSDGLVKSDDPGSAGLLSLHDS